MFDRIRIRLHCAKLNQETLRKIGPRVWERVLANDEDLAVELSQAILVSHMDMIVAALDHLGVPHSEGFFDKDANVGSYLPEGWQQRLVDHLSPKFPEALIVFYVNHLAHEVNPEAPVFVPAGAQ